MIHYDDDSSTTDESVWGVSCQIDDDEMNGWIATAGGQNHCIMGVNAQLNYHKRVAVSDATYK